MRIVLLFAAVIACRADIIDLGDGGYHTYRYFYACDSGLVDCGGFGRHFFGDFGMEGVKPTNWSTGNTNNPFGGFHVQHSNSRGEVIGRAIGAQSTPTPAYGFQGEVTCPNGCFDQASAALDINENGIALWFASSEHGPMITVGRDRWRKLDVDREAIFNQSGVILPGFSPTLGLAGIFASRINDLDQILILDGARSPFGVLSPFEVVAVPELSSVWLLLIVMGVLLFRRPWG